MAEKPINLKESLKKLDTIVEWFEAQEEIDVEAGLEKVKEGAALVKVCRKRLSEIENEFEQIERETEEDTIKARGVKATSTKAVRADDIPF